MAYGGTKAGTSGSYSQATVQGNKSVTTNHGYRGVHAGGDPSMTTYSAWSFGSFANSYDFGELTQGKAQSGGHTFASNGKLGLVNPETNTQIYDMFNFVSGGGATTFGGTAGSVKGGANGVCDGARVVRALSADTPTNTDREYLQIESQGDALDFGLHGNSSAWNGGGNATNGSRSVDFGGYGPAGGGYSSSIAYYNIGIIGDSHDFGEWSPDGNTIDPCGTSDGSRGVFAGGGLPTVGSNQMTYVNIGTTGSGVDFGNLAQGVFYAASSGDGNRGMILGSYPNPGTDATSMQYWTIPILSSAADFAELHQARWSFSASSGA